MSSSINNFLTSNRFRLDYADQTGGPFRMRANITLLMRLIDNICANIVKHGSPSQPVELTASVEEGFLVLRESNAVLRKTVKTAAGDSGYGLVICEDVMSALGAASPTERRTAASASSCAFPSCRAGNSRCRRKNCPFTLANRGKTAAI